MICKRKEITGLSGEQADLLNTFISKSIFGHGTGQLRLSGFNLPDTSSDISQSNGANYVEINKTNALHRYALLNLVYNFSDF